VSLFPDRHLAARATALPYGLLNPTARLAMAKLWLASFLTRILSGASPFHALVCSCGSPMGTYERVVCLQGRAVTKICVELKGPYKGLKGLIRP